MKHSIVQRRSGDPDKLVADSLKANIFLGWKAQKTVKDAIKDAYDFIKSKEKNS